MKAMNTGGEADLDRGAGENHATFAVDGMQRRVCLVGRVLESMPLVSEQEADLGLAELVGQRAQFLVRYDDDCQRNDMSVRMAR